MKKKEIEQENMIKSLKKKDRRRYMMKCLKKKMIEEECVGVGGLSCGCLDRRRMFGRDRRRMFGRASVLCCDCLDKRWER